MEAETSLEADKSASESWSARGQGSAETGGGRLRASFGFGFGFGAVGTEVVVAQAARRTVRAGLHCTEPEGRSIG